MSSNFTAHTARNDGDWRKIWPLRHASTIFVGAIAAIPLISFLYVAFARLRYPLDLEWLEGTSIGMARRFAAGLPLYPPPTINHVSVRYFPLYFIAVGSLFKGTGVNYWAGRLVSILATVGTGGLAFWTVWRVTRKSSAALITAGMWFAAFGFSGYFYDLNRIDSFAVFLLMASYAAAFLYPGARGGALAGLLLTASAFTKQNHIAFIAPIAFAQVLRRDWRGALACAVAFMTSFGAGAAAWNWASGGSFWLLTMQFIPFGAVRSRLMWFPLDYLRYFPAALVVVIFYSVRLAKRCDALALFGDPWLGYWAACVALAWVFRVSVGCYTNVYMPAALATAVATGVMLPTVIEAAPEWLRRQRLWLAPLVAATLIFPVFIWPKGQIPPPSQWAAARRLRDFVRAEHGQVFMTDFLLFEPNVLQFHSINFQDMRKPGGAWKAVWRQQLQAELDRARPSLVIPFGATSRGKEYDRMLEGMVREPLPMNMRPRTVTGFDAGRVYFYRRPPPPPGGNRDPSAN